MTAYVALLRAVNVLGTGKLPMTELKSMCEAAGFQSVRTYIASGNVVFQSKKKEAQVKALLEAALLAYSGKPMAALVRTAEEMAAVLAANPYADHPGDRTVAFFLDHAPTQSDLDCASKLTNERLSLGTREIYVAYPDGIGQSRLNLPASRIGTARNMNTIAKLAQMAADLPKKTK
jgi:uncharacterized protein (DUF1697 family)